MLVTNFQKSPSAESFPLPALLELWFWWPEVAWFSKLWFF